MHNVQQNRLNRCTLKAVHSAALRAQSAVKCVAFPLCSTTGLWLPADCPGSPPRFQTVAARYRAPASRAVVTKCSQYVSDGCNQSISRFLSRNPSAKTYRLRAQSDHDTESRFAIQKENQIRSPPSAHTPECRAGNQHGPGGVDLARDRGRSGYRKETEGGMGCCPRRWLRHSISSVSGLRVPSSEQVAKSYASTHATARLVKAVSHNVGFRIIAGVK